MSRARPAVLTMAVLVIVAVAVAACSGGGGGGSGSRNIRSPNLNGIPASRHAPSIPAHGAYFGAWVRQGAYNQANQVLAIDMLQGAIGRPLDIVHTYLTWQALFPKASDQVALRQGSALLVSWTGAASKGVADGAYDNVIRQTAQEMKAAGKPIFLEWRWEMDRSNLRSVVGTPAQFIAAWKHVRAIFAQEHVSNVAWVWCPTAKGFTAGGDAAAYYPGDSQVDWICSDAYPGYGPYRSFATAADPFLAWASHHRKPVMIGEYGVQQSYGPQQRAQWLRAAAQTVRHDPQIKALVYFDANAAGSTPTSAMSLEYGTAPMQAFRQIADSPYFNPRHLKVSGQAPG